MSLIQLDITLHDLLEGEVEQSFYIPSHKYKIDKLPHQEVSYCIDANYHKGTSVDGFINKKRRQLVQVGELTTRGAESNRRIYDSNFLSPTLSAMQGGNRQPKIFTPNGVRKLTPLECWRVMGFTDEDFLKAKNAGLSNTKLYERSGRGIVVPMLECVFAELRSMF